MYIFFVDQYFFDISGVPTEAIREEAEMRAEQVTSAGRESAYRQKALDRVNVAGVAFILSLRGRGTHASCAFCSRPAPYFLSVARLCSDCADDTLEELGHLLDWL